MCQITVNPPRAEEDEEDIDSGPLPIEPDPVVREQQKKKKIRMSLFSPDLVTSMMMIAPSVLRRKKLGGFLGETPGGGIPGAGTVSQSGPSGKG